MRFYLAFLCFFCCFGCNNTPPQQPVVLDRGFPFITGDFNGDGSSEELRLFVYTPKGDTLDKKRLSDSLNKDMSWLGKGELLANTTNIPKFAISGDCIGLFWLNNEGDLDGDGADDISFIRDWATSGIRDLEVFSLKNGSWQSLTAFMINISLLETNELPDLVQKGKKAGSLLIREYDVMVDSLWVRRETSILSR